MDPIQDEKFDQLFKDQFENAEMKPPAGLWAGIEDKLEVKTVKGRLPFYWMAGALIVVLITVGLLFLTKQEKIQLHSADRIVTSVVRKAEVIFTPITDTVILQKKTTPQRIVSVKTTASPVLVTNFKKDIILIQSIQPIRHLDVVVEHPVPIVNSNQVVLASVHPSEITSDEVLNENDRMEKRGIRNMGDLINYVVDKVDKREQKFLKFKTDDDDNSSLVAINIGFIKFNPKKHK